MQGTGKVYPMKYCNYLNKIKSRVNVSRYKQTEFLKMSIHYPYMVTVEINVNCTFRTIIDLKNYSVQVEPWPSGPGNEDFKLKKTIFIRVVHIN